MHNPDIIIFCQMNVIQKSMLRFDALRLIQIVKILFLLINRFFGALNSFLLQPTYKRYAFRIFIMV